MTDDEKRYEELKSILQPPKANVDEKDIVIAHARAALENLLWDDMLDILIYIKWLQDPEDPDISGWTAIKDPEKVKNWAEISANSMWKRLHADNETQENWELLEPGFRRNTYDYLDDMHGGDCTAFASTCMRCFAESKFKIPSTVNWSKGEGYKMENEFFDLKKKLKK
jgi:hypothetical protein